MNKSKAYFNKILIIDCETSGLAFGSDNPAVHLDQYFQAVSWGIIVADADTLTPLDELYVEIQWDGKSQWSPQAEKVHGLSKEYLNKNGVPMSQAVEEIGSLILKHFGPNGYPNIAGNNPHFDLCFLRQTLRSEGIEIRFSNRLIDTNSIGFAVYGTYSSDELFDIVSPNERTGTHNALDDARNVLKVLKRTKQLCSTFLG
jgi:hypothetical protein